MPSLHRPVALWSRHGHRARDQEDRGHGRRWAEHVESGGWSPGAALFSPEGTRDPQTATAGPTQHGGPGNTPHRGNLGGWRWVPEQEPGWGCRQGHQVPALGSMRKELCAKPFTLLQPVPDPDPGPQHAEPHPEAEPGPWRHDRAISNVRVDKGTRSAHALGRCEGTGLLLNPS